MVHVIMLGNYLNKINLDIIDIRREKIPTIKVIKNNCSELYISTTTVILYLDSSINLRYIFPIYLLYLFINLKKGYKKINEI